MFDISIILNLHREAVYLRRTMLSLEQATLFAQRHGKSVELVVILDRPDNSTRSWVKKYYFDVFDGHQVQEVDNGSLALSRNDGIMYARGEYITTADGDDLVSFDSLLRCLETAQSCHERTIVLPQYICAFGERCWTWEYFGSDKIGIQCLFNYHPYISRIFARRELFRDLAYTHQSKEVGYAFEDWHLALELSSRECSFAIAKGVTLFYRQRAGSIMSQERVGRSIPGQSTFFKPSVFLRLSSLKRVKEEPVRDAQLIRDGFLSNVGIRDTVVAANRIDPAISLEVIANSPFGSNFPPSSFAPDVYLDLCRLVGKRQFTDVVLVPFMVRGGAEKFLLQVLRGLTKLDPTRMVLVLSGQPIRQHEGLEDLPSNCLFIDLFSLAAQCSNEERNYIALRLIQHTAPHAEVHIKSCEFTHDFVSQHSAKLKECRFNFYYFCDRIAIYDGEYIEHGVNFNFISENASILYRVISDHKQNLGNLARRIDNLPVRLEHLYANAEISEAALKASPRPLRHRLLWASRIDAQKRPELLMKLAGAIRRVFPTVSIDVFGAAALESINVELLEACADLNYRGPFNGLKSIPASEYDALLYTSHFDGLPNIILESMAEGLVVVAPALGGIGEVVNDHNGFLIPNSSDDEVMLAGYLEVLNKIYNENCDLERLRHNGLKTILEQHSEPAYLRRLAEVFGMR